MAQGFLRVCLEECHVDFLIKTQEAGLDIVMPWGFLGTTVPMPMTLNMSRGQMPSGWSPIGSMPLEGVVAWVQEEGLRSGKQVEFWVLTSLEELTAWQMRELAHWRWDIENNGFCLLYTSPSPRD